MVRRLLKRGHSLDRFLSRRRMSSSSSFSSSSSSSSSSSKSARMEEEAAAAPLPPTQKRSLSRSHGSRATLSRLPDLPPLAASLPDRENALRMASRAARDVGPPSDMDLMKEKFGKLLLGEDMSGSGKGVSSALALSNAITNLAASVFGEQRRLEPMSADRKARWNKETDWLLSVTDHIVEFVPSQQVSKDGTNMEIMVTQQRRDLHMNIPALRKLDAMLLEYLDNFKDAQEFWYVSKDADESEKGDASRKDDKWWIPTVRVSPDGLSDASKKWLQHQKDLVGQVLKAVMAINANVLMEMEIPEAYIESLPKNGRSSLGDSIYKIITDDYFDPNELLSSVDLSTEHKIVGLKDRIEASVVIWQRKMCSRDSKISWGASVSFEKREQFEERAQTVLLILKHRFPGLAQSSLDISKIQYNRDVGYAILESYSRTLESLAFAVMSRIEDVLDADSIARDPERVSSRRRPSLTDYPETEIEMVSSLETDSATLTDLVGLQQQDLESSKKYSDNTDASKALSAASMNFSYIEKLENVGGGSRSFSQR